MERKENYLEHLIKLFVRIITLLVFFAYKAHLSLFCFFIMSYCAHSVALVVLSEEKRWGCLHFGHKHLCLQAFLSDYLETVYSATK